MIGSEACNTSIQTLRAILLIWSTPESRDSGSASARTENEHHKPRYEIWIMHHKQISANYTARTCQFSRRRNILCLPYQNYS